MLRNFAAALLATTLIAGPAFAAQSTDTAGATKATPSVAATTTVKTGETQKPVKMVKHLTKHTRKHVAHRAVGAMHQASRLKPAKTHQASIAKPVKTGDKAAM
jgi:hypothetical protein